MQNLDFERNNLLKLMYQPANCTTDNLENPPSETCGELWIIKSDYNHVDDVEGSGEIQTLLRPLNDMG